MGKHYDITVIGSGPGGYAAALAASRKNFRVALIEKEQLGGVCLNSGCIPTKAIISASHLLRKISRAKNLGINTQQASVDWGSLQLRLNDVTTFLRSGLNQILNRQKIEIIYGNAFFQSPESIAVESSDSNFEITSDKFVIAAGASAYAGPWRFDGKKILSYKDMLFSSELPSSLLIIGAGAIGCEFASCFASFGVKVVLVEQEPQLLPKEDPEAVRIITRSLEAQGIRVFTSCSIESIKESQEGIEASLSNGEVIKTQKAVLSIGQRPNVQGIGLESIGIENKDGVKVDEFLITRHAHIAAIGDCLPGRGLAHWASYEGTLALNNLCEDKKSAADASLIPRCVFTDPELAHVGLSEPEAGDSVRVSRFSFAALGKSVCDDETEGFVKLLVDSGTARVLGATIVGHDASALIHAVSVAIKHRLSARELADTVTAHPTSPEAFTESAAQVYGEALSSLLGARAARGRKKG